MRTALLICSANLALLLASPAMAAPSHQSNRRKSAPAVPPAPEAAPPAPAIDLQPARLRLNAPDTAASGKVSLMYSVLVHPNTVLRLQQDPHYTGPVRVSFKANEGKDFINLDAQKCGPAAPCDVEYALSGLWQNGQQEVTLQAISGNQQPLTISIPVQRFDVPPAPILTGDGLPATASTEQVVSLDTSKGRVFWWRVGNPAGAEPDTFTLSAAGFTPNPCGATASIQFSPSDVYLDSGETKSVRVETSACVTSTIDGSLDVARHKHPDLQLLHRRLQIAGVNEWWRTASYVPALLNKVPDWVSGLLLSPRLWLTVFVLAGAGISIFLNVFFPFQRARNRLYESLDRTQTSLSAIGLLAGITDPLEGKVMGLRLLLKDIKFYQADKTEQLAAAQKSCNDIAAAIVMARDLADQQDRLAESLNILSIRTYGEIAADLRKARESLMADDAKTSAAALNDARANLATALQDSNQTKLRASLGERITSVLQAQRRKYPQFATAAAGDHYLRGVVQSAIEALISFEPTAANNTLSAISCDQLLKLEGYSYLVEAWINHVEDCLQRDKARFSPFAAGFIDSFLKNPKSEMTQVIVDLFKSDTTPDDIVRAIKEVSGDGARKAFTEIVTVRCPYYYQQATFTFAMKGPLANVPAVQHFLNYTWSFDDTPCSHATTYQCQHFFTPRRGRDAGNGAFRVSATVNVPFATEALSDTEATTSTNITPQSSLDIKRTLGLEAAAFAVNASIAVLVAWLAKYATDKGGVDMPLHAADCANAFLYGFGLDQLRDTVTSQSTTRLPAPTPAPPPPPPPKPAQAAAG